MNYESFLSEKQVYFKSAGFEPDNINNKVPIRCEHELAPDWIFILQAVFSVIYSSIQSSNMPPLCS